jgi:hypothetical protein
MTNQPCNSQLSKIQEAKYEFLVHSLATELLADAGIRHPTPADHAEANAAIIHIVAFVGNELLNSPLDWPSTLDAVNDALSSASQLLWWARALGCPNPLSRPAGSTIH